MQGIDYTCNIRIYMMFDDDTVSSQNDIGIFALQRMDLLDSFWGIVFTGSIFSISVFIMFQFFVSIPEEVLDWQESMGQHSGSCL